MRYWLRFKHAERFGALLTRQQVCTLIPILVGCLALTLLFGSIFVAGVISLEGNSFVFAGCLAGLLCILVTAQLRYLLGYLRRDRLAVLPELARKIEPAPNWPRFGYSPQLRVLRSLAGGRKQGALWIAAIGVWLVAVAVLLGVLSGDFVPR